ncbi:MAG: TIR domain-containing protein [Candidatus Parcubacteria bacterium]|nr:TIR domain-containing protein [Candidatus Parcubacteria bacterium]
MMRKVFFSFHYERDILRVGQIRNSGIVLAPGDTSAGFTDSASWESIKRQGDDAIKRWIGDQLKGTSVTVVLIGAETANRPWVNYEIQESIKCGNGLLGIYIHNVLDLNRRTDTKGANPFDYLTWTKTGRPISETYRTYDWISDSGRQNLPAWIEAAARDAGR